MNDLTFFFSLAFCSLVAIYSLWFICHYNGKILLYLIVKNNDQTPEYLPTICLIGASPLAIISILTAALNSCFNNLYYLLFLELIFIIIFIFIPKTLKRQWDLLGFKYIKSNSTLIICLILWCHIFAFWAIVNHKPNLDYIILNTNPDIWAYVRRFAAFTTSNLNFYGRTDGFTFNGNSACDFLLGSPKKFSSFLGSLFIYLFRGSSFGIAVFQGMLGGVLLLVLFKEWFTVQWSTKPGLSLGKIILITWVLFSPPIIWLLVSAYFSNTLFLIVVCLTLRHTRKFALNSHLDTSANYLCFLGILIIVFAFYPAFLSIILVVYLVTVLIYSNSRKLKPLIILLFITIGCGLIFYLVFPSQLGLYEVSKSLNLLDRHGSNFVPLNPWSLLQEKPKPMALQRDFGYYINLIISLPFSLFLGWKVWQKYQQTSQPNDRQNLLAASVGISLYIGYLLAYIPLEHTYRLMKIVISLIYPLAIFGLLPLLLWSKNQLSGRSSLIRNTILVLVVIHTILHIEKVFSLETFPSGNFTLAKTEKLEYFQSIVIVGCRDAHKSQFYERLVGLRIAINYPNLQVNVVNAPESLDDSIQGDLFLYGESNTDNSCLFSLDKVTQERRNN
jgi:hypothetical protein